MTRVRTAVVIGGGIAGPATGIALQKAGIEAVVFEARNRPDGVGTFLTLGANGVDALRVLGADQAALAVGFATPGITLRNSKGKHLGVSSTGPSLPDGTTSQTMKRADLSRALHDEAERRGVRIEHGKRLVRAEETDAGVRAVFADGSEATGDVLVGCDGIHSTVRRIIDPNAPAPSYSGLLTTGGYVRGIPVNTSPGSYEMIFGRRAFFGHALAPDGEVWWFANVPRRAEPTRGEVESVGTEQWRHRLGTLFADDDGPALRLVQATTEVMTATPIHTVPHLPRWHRGRMVVLGDAAHAPSPSSGQGASLSIEDAVVLAKSLRDQPDAQKAFALFASVRRPRVERIIKAAARINSSKAAGPVGRLVRDAMLPVVVPMAARSKGFRQTYDHHIDWDAPTAAAV